MWYFAPGFMIPYYEVMNAMLRHCLRQRSNRNWTSDPDDELRLSLAPARLAGDEDEGGNGSGNDGGDGGTNTGVVVRTKPKTKKPSMYKVIMLNDDYTPMEFVVLVLERFFAKNHEDATRIMLHVHQKGVGVCGVFTYEVAETKVQQVMDLARQHQHPLQCTLEKA